MTITELTAGESQADGPVRRGLRAASFAMRKQQRGFSVSPAVQLGVASALSSLMPLLLVQTRSTPPGAFLWDRAVLGLQGDLARETTAQSTQMTCWVYALGLTLIPLTALVPRSPIAARMLSRTTLARVAFIGWLRDSLWGCAALLGTMSTAAALFWLLSNQLRPDHVPLFIWITAVFLPMAPWWTALMVRGGVPSFQDTRAMSLAWPRVLAAMWLGAVLAWGLVRLGAAAQGAAVTAEPGRAAAAWATAAAFGILGVLAQRRLFILGARSHGSP